MKINLSKANLLRLISLGIIAVGILADQLTKLLAVAHLSEISTFPLWKGVFHLTYVENRGAAFGMLAEHRWIFMVVSSVAILALLAWLVLSKDLRPLSVISLSMIASGGIANMIDRVRLGYVVDFFDFTLIDFAVFNVADCFVCIGAGILALAMVLDLVREKKKTAKGEAADEADG
jgi:signal peptidase II